MLRYNSVKCRFLKWEDLTLHCECLLANEGPFRHVSIHALKWRVRREGEFVVHSIYFMATDFKQISDYPYCLIICLGGWAICEMLAFQMLEQCALNVYSKTSPPQLSTLAVSNLWIQNKCWRKEHLQSCVVSITSLKCIYKWSRQRSKCLQKNCYFINIFFYYKGTSYESASLEEIRESVVFHLHVLFIFTDMQMQV